MVTAEMEIMGDPYFIPQQTGNHAALNGSNPSITDDGTLNSLDQSVFCIVNFRTPFDYQVKGATMEFPQLVPGFSGLFQIWAVTNNFRGGKFTQTLKMIRRRGQDDEATTGPSGVVQVNNSAALNQNRNQSDGTVGASATAGTGCEPAPANDDIRNLMPAVSSDVAAQLAAPFAQIEQQVASAIPNLDALTSGVDFGIAEVPDLTKVIPGFNIGQVDPGLLSAVSSAQGQLSGALGQVGNLENQARAAASQAQAAVNNAANQGVAAASNAARARIRSLLG